MATGIRKRHTAGCPGIEVKARCSCNAGYEASAYDKHTGKKRRKSFAKKGEATTWRTDMMSALAKGAPGPAPAIPITRVPTLDTAWKTWKACALAGTIRTRSRKPYKPATIRRYDQSMRVQVLDEFGTHRLTQISHKALQDFADELDIEGRSASDIEVAFLPLRAIYKRAIKNPESGVTVDPCYGLELPKDHGRREQIVTATEAAALIAAIPKLSDRVIWATAFYAGLRRGELRALRRKDIDLAQGVIHVRKGWDTYEGEIELKSESGLRKVPILGVLRDMLMEYLATEPDLGPEDRIFTGGRRSTAFGADKLQKRADEAWEAAALERVTLHVCRHGYASIMIHAGIASGKFNPKALSTFMGHSSIKVTFDTYAKQMPGAEAEAAEMVDAYLAAQLKAAEDDARQTDVALAGA
jgi:integrase